RDRNVTGVQTCALPIYIYHQQFTTDADGALSSEDTVEVIPIEAFETIVRSGDTIIGTGLERIDEAVLGKATTFGKESITAASLRSEERRVGKERSTWWW